MNVAQVVQAIRQEGALTLRDVITRFEGRNPDQLGPPGRLPLIDQLRADTRLDVDTAAALWQVRLR